MLRKKRQWALALASSPVDAGSHPFAPHFRLVSPQTRIRSPSAAPLASRPQQRTTRPQKHAAQGALRETMCG